MICDSGGLMFLCVHAITNAVLLLTGVMTNGAKSELFLDTWNIVMNELVGAGSWIRDAAVSSRDSGVLTTLVDAGSVSETRIRIANSLSGFAV
jgi:hypothetical protein